MKVHPAPKKRNITTTTTMTSQYDMASSTPNPKKLRRLPHVFAKVLELPFHSDTDVSVQETSESFCFTASTEDMTDHVRAHAIEIFPGVTKIVIKGMDGVDLWVRELELDLWRFRLPASTRPEMASARCSGGELIVIVPKEENLRDIDDVDDHDEVCGEDNGRIVIVE